MQELKKVLLNKAKIIEELKTPLQNNRQAMLYYFKSIKKQQQQNEAIEKQILSGVDSLELQRQQNLQKFYHFSFTVMKSLCKDFQFTDKENEIFSDIVEMYCKFYRRKEASEIVDQIQQILRSQQTKKEKLLKKLIQSLYQWTKQKFSKAFQQVLNHVQKDLLVRKFTSSIKISQSPSNQEDRILRKDANFHVKSTNLYSSQKLSRKQIKSEIKTATHKAVTLFTEQSQVLFIKPQQKKYDLSTRMSTSYDPQKSEEINPKTLDMKKRSLSYNKSCMQRQKSVIFAPNINKEIFFGAFNQQFNQIYKSLGDVMDVDSYFLRSFRRQRQEFKNQIIFNRMNEVADLMLKNMPKVQKNIDRYSQQYAKHCPAQIKALNSESKIVIHQPNRKLKSTSLQKSHKEKLNLPQKLKSQEGPTNNDKQIEKLFKNSKTNRLRQRNKSFQQRVTRKSSEQKTQMTTKLPTVYTPQFLYPREQFQSEKVMGIHQKLQNFNTNMNKLQSKGLIRYKLLNKDRQKHAIEQQIFNSQRNFPYGTELFQTKKLSEFQVANIRKLLRIREKQRIISNKTPLTSSVKQSKQDINNLMEEVKIMDSQRSKELQNCQNTNKYQVFLSTLNGNASKNEFKLSDKSPYLISYKDSDFCFSSRKKQKEYLPKIF